MEAFCTSSATSSAVIEELRPLFAKFGLPETIVTDNGPCFVGEEFRNFLDCNGIRHITSAPYHPASNGLAERAVQIVKRGLQKTNSGSARARIAKFLFAYRLAPQTTTGVSPAEMLLGRRPRSRLDILRPLTAERVERQQLQQKGKHDAHSLDRSMQAGDTVFVRNYHQGDKWLPGTLEKQTGPVSFAVRLSDGRHRRCHQDQVRKRLLELEPPAREVTVEVPTPPCSNPPIETRTEVTVEVPTPPCPDPQIATRTDELEIVPEKDREPVRATPKSYPKRDRKGVDRFEPKW